MEILINVLIFLLYVVLTGFLGRVISTFLDGCMDYGHIFSFVRHGAAKRSATKFKSLTRFYEKEKEFSKLTFGERLTAYDSLYWELATKDNSLVSWLCINCFTTRITLLISVFLSPFLVYHYGADLTNIYYGLSAIAYILLSPIFAVYFLKL